MKGLFSILVCSLLLNTGCALGALQGGTIGTSQPVQQTVYSFGVVAWGVSGPLPNATVYLNNGDSGYYQHQTDANGYVFLASVLPFSDIKIAADGYQPFAVGIQPPKLSGQNVRFTLTRIVPPFPPAPTRAQVIALKMRFQGLTCHTTQYGDLPWFDDALFSLTPADRQLVYACKRAAGDTHAIVTFDNNTGSIYDEPGQPYQQMNGADFENHQDAFVAAVREVVVNGFIPTVFLGGDGPNGEPIATRQFPEAHAALAAAPEGDLNTYVLYMPGWDSVFYGWEPANTVIPGFGAMVRSLCPNCYLGIEFNTGHIPVGNGPADYAADGPMTSYDVLVVEFDDSLQHQDSTWQVLARLLGPAYVRPADQPPTDDPNPPYYLRAGTPRGAWAVACFEWSEYDWVRGRVSAADVAAQAAYLRGLGCSVIQ